jgi:dolichol-phosphate mannosyltransferase
VQVSLLRHERNRGLGAALRSGFRAATGARVVTTDSDGTYRFADIPGLLACLDGGADLATASPYHPAGRVVGVPPARLLLSQAASLLYRLLVDRRIHTYTSLFRAYRRTVLEQVTFASDGFLGGTELLVKARLRGFKVAEYPATLSVRQMGVSKLRLGRTIRAHLQFQARLLLLRLGLVRRL